MSHDAQDVFLLVGSADEPVVREMSAKLGATVVVAEFPPGVGEWIPYHIHRTAEENLALIRSRLEGRRPRRTVVLLEPGYEALQNLGRILGGADVEFFDAAGPTTPARYEARRKRAELRRKWETLRRLANPKELRLSMLYGRALAHGRTLLDVAPAALRASTAKPEGVSVVIPSRNGRELLERCLASLAGADEIVVVDNGSADGTREWLARAYPDAIVEQSAEPLPFAAAMNRGIRRARFAYVCALNNDMEVEPGFLPSLRAAFGGVPDLFCATAQIFLPEGRRREETGKTAMTPAPGVRDLPVRCDVPLEGEDQSYVPYGSGGCSLFHAEKLEALGGFDEAYVPAYFEDFDLGLRAWAQGWPSVYCAGARALHRHRATTSRYFTPQELALTLEKNYLRFVAKALPRLWEHAILRLKVLGNAKALSFASTVSSGTAARVGTELCSLFDGSVAVFPGRAKSGKPVVLIASPYLPFPLSHGAAVRIYNLLRETADAYDLVLVAFTEEPRPVPRELLDVCVEVVTVHRKGTHALPSRGRPDVVEEFDVPAYRQALLQTVKKWKPEVAQLEFTQMAIYAPDCAPARTILVEHDITYDLYAQMLARPETKDWETRRQHELWVKFETDAWTRVDRVVTMSEKDRAIAGANAVAAGNGVDLERFQPSAEPPEPRRLLFIGSFAHRPNVLALEFFLREVFPLLRGVTLHVIAGLNHTRFWDLHHPGVEVEGFVSDVRPAYRRASVVIAPLIASAGTNVKIVEAMAMGKAIVSTEAGIHGLELERGKDVLVADDPVGFAALIARVLESPEERAALERHGRATAERAYGWKAMARIQKDLYQSLRAKIE